MKLADALNISKKPASPKAESFGVFLACGFEPLHLVTFLEAHLRLHFPNRSIEIHTGLYGDPEGNMGRAIQGKCDVAAIVMEWQDLDPRLGLRSVGSRTPKSLPDILTHARIRAGFFLDLLQKTARAVPSILCLPTLPLPPVSSQPEVQAGSFEWNMRGIIVSLATKVDIPAKPATRSGSKRPLIGAKRRWMVIIRPCGRNESRGSGVSAWIPRTVPAGKRCG